MKDIISLSIFALVITLAVGFVSRLLFKKLGSFTYINKFPENDQLALLEAALMTIYVDGSREFTEEMALATIIKQVEWKFDLDKEMRRIDTNALEALQDADKMQEYLQDLRAKVSSPKIAKKIFEVCDDLSVQGSIRKGFGGTVPYRLEINYLNQLQKILNTVPEQIPAKSRLS